MTKTETNIQKEDRIDRHEGVEAYGYFTEFVRFNRESGNLHSQVQIFMVEKAVYVYQRAAGASKGRWSAVVYKSHDEAREQVRTLLAKAESDVIGAIQRGVPTVVQLTETDLESVKNGEMPPARFDGGTRNNRLFGKIVDATWKAS